MGSQTEQSYGRVSIYICIAVALSLGVFAWMTKAYFVARLELMEAHGALGDILYGSWLVGHNLDTGNVEKAFGFAVTNQIKGIQYAVRRNVKDRNIHQVAEYCFTKANLPLSEEQRLFYRQYDEAYRSWASSGWIDGNMPLIDQFVDVLYYYWADCRPRWTTWKPRDYATNIKVGSPEERSRKRQPRLEDQVPIDEKLRRALENVNAESDSDEGAENDH